MKDINNSDMEKMLISGKSIDELIQMKIQEDYKSLREEIKKTPKIEKITDISKVPMSLIFSKAAVYKVFNKTTRTESLINGIQAESMRDFRNRSEICFWPEKLKLLLPVILMLNLCM